MHAICIPGTSDHVSDLIGNNYLNSFYDELLIEMMRLMAPCQTAHRMNAVDQISSKNIVSSLYIRRLMAPCQTAHRMNAVDQISSKNIVSSLYIRI